MQEKLGMPRKGQRYSLKSSETKTILVKASKKLEMNIDELIDSKANLEAVEMEREG